MRGLWAFSLGALSWANCVWADEAKHVQLPAPISVVSTLTSSQPLGSAQTDRYQRRVKSLEEHDLAVQTRQAAVPFSARQAEASIVKPPPSEARLSKGVFVMQPTDVTLLSNANYHYVSTVAEPSVLVSGKNVLVTFNWGAAWSSDGGKTFAQLDPFTIFGSPSIGQGFCCDQVTAFSPGHNLLVWLLQGIQSDAGNTVRILVTRAEDIGPGKPPSWKAYDVSPQMVGLSSTWFDYPDISVTDNSLFVSLNAFTTSEPSDFTNSAILRLNLAELAEGKAPTLDFILQPGVSAFSSHFAQGGKGRVFWASHSDTAHLLLRSWADTDREPSPYKTIAVERYQYVNGGPPAPNGKPWLTRLDDRITAGWEAAGKLGFAWSSGPIAGDGGQATYPLPHVRVAIINEQDALSQSADIIRPIAEPHIWSSNLAFAYIAAAPDQTGKVGFGLYYGGPRNYPGGAVGIFDTINGTWAPSMSVLSEGQTSPRCETATGIDDMCGKWGDYLSVRPNFSGAGWYASVASEQDRGGNELPHVAITFSPFTQVLIGTQATSQ